MSTDLELRWEWPDGRQAQSKLIILVEKTAPADQGLFGLKSSPSIADSLPDPVAVAGRVVKGDDKYLNKAIRLILPQVEMGDVATNDHIFVGVIEANIFICIKKIDSVETDLTELDC